MITVALASNAQVTHRVVKLADFTRLAVVDDINVEYRCNPDSAGLVVFDATQEVADALFDTAAAWLKERGCGTMRGPANPSLNHTVGLLIEGFDSSPFFMMTYNPPYYEKLVENAGFTKSQDLYSFWANSSATVDFPILLAPSISNAFVPFVSFFHSAILL